VGRRLLPLALRLLTSNIVAVWYDSRSPRVPVCTFVRLSKHFRQLIVRRITWMYEHSVDR